MNKALKILLIFLSMSYLLANNLFANILIKGNFITIGDAYITGKGNIYITKKYLEGVKPEEFLKLSKEFDVTVNAIKNFFNILKKKNVSPDNLDHTFRQIAKRHKQLKEKLKQFNLFFDPEIQKLRNNAEKAINSGDYAKADLYLDNAFEKQMICINITQNKCMLSAANIKSEKGELELIRMNYKKAAQYFKEAIQTLPKKNNLKKTEYLTKYANSSFYAGLYLESQKALEECLAIKQMILPENHKDIAATLVDLSRSYFVQNKLEKIESMLKKALDIKIKEVGSDHLEVHLIINNLGWLYIKQEKFVKAENCFKKNLNCKELKNSYEFKKDLAYLFNKTGKYKEKEEIIKTNLEEITKNIYSLVDDPEMAKMAKKYLKLAEMGKLSELEKLLPNIRKLVENKYGKNSIKTSKSYEANADLYVSLEKYEKANIFYTKAEVINRKYFGKNNIKHTIILDKLTQLYILQKHYIKAEEVCKRSIKIKKKSLGAEHPELASSYNILGDIYLFQGNIFTAKDFYYECLEIYKNALGEDSLSVANMLYKLAKIYKVGGTTIRREKFYNRVLAIQEKKLGKNHPIVADTLCSLATVYQAKHLYSKVKLLLKRSLDIYDNAYGKNHILYKKTLNRYNSLKHKGDNKPCMYVEHLIELPFYLLFKIFETLGL